MWNVDVGIKLTFIYDQFDKKSGSGKNKVGKRERKKNLARNVRVANHRSAFNRVKLQINHTTYK